MKKSWKLVMLVILLIVCLLPMTVVGETVGNETISSDTENVQGVENGEEIEPVDAEGEEEVVEITVYELSLEDSIAMAVETHPDLAVAKIEHEQAKADLRQAQRTAKNIRDARSITISNLPPEVQDSIRMEMRGLYAYDVYLAERVYPLAMAMAERLADRALEYRTNVLKFQIENGYYAVLRAENDLQNALDSLTRAKEQLRLAKVGLDVGVNAPVDVLGAEVMVASQELMVKAAQNTLTQVKMDFNHLLGLSLEDEVNLTSQFIFEKKTFDLDEIKERAKERDISYIQLQESYQVQEAAFELAKAYYTPNVYTYQDVQRDYQIAELKLKNADQTLNLKIKKADLNMATAEERVSLMEKSVEQAREGYRLTKLRYEVGMGTLLDLEKASGDLEKAKSELISALYDYNLAAAMLNHGLFDLGGSGNGR